MRQLCEHVGSGVAPALDKFDGWVSELFAFAKMAGEQDSRDAQRLTRRRRPAGGHYSRCRSRCLALMAAGPRLGAARP